jgi:small subunit ribosomal protein S6
MKHYETLMLLPVSATTNEIALIEKQFKALTKTANGSVTVFDKWGRYRLAYPINKQEYGVYLLARYEVEEPTSFFQKLDTFLKVKCVDSVMRYVHVVLSAAAYAQPYIKPEAMEGAGHSRDRRSGFGVHSAAGAASDGASEAGEIVEDVAEAVEAAEVVIEG